MNQTPQQSATVTAVLQRLADLLGEVTQLSLAVEESGDQIAALVLSRVHCGVDQIAADMAGHRQAVEDAKPREVIPEPAKEPKAPKAMRYARD